MTVTVFGNGTVTGISAGGLPDGCIQSADLASGTGGKVLQVVATTVTAQNSSTNTDEDTYSGIGLEVAITPVSSSSRFHLTCHIGIGTCVSSNTWGIVLFRDASKVGNGAEVGSRKGVWFRGVDHTGGAGTDTNHGVGVSGSYFDTTTGTAGSAITFKAGGLTEAGTMYINRMEAFSDGASVHQTTTSSTITVMEVEA